MTTFNELSIGTYFTFNYPEYTNDVYVKTSRTTCVVVYYYKDILDYLREFDISANHYVIVFPKVAMVEI